jgi:tryptophanyl-tRNA synthetase
MQNKRTLTGIKPTGVPHLGNYVGAIKPALALAEQSSQSFYFIADYHALTSEHNAEAMRRQTIEVAATWLACGLDPEKVCIYKQSDISEIFELNWILACFTPKGLMNRAHSYKAAVARNEETGETDRDSGINMGLYNYPVLMSADILLFDIDIVPVGEDQIQHIEIARDIAGRLNHNYGKSVLKQPNYFLQSPVSVIGLDGRKMSKSYGNSVSLFEEPKALRKQIMRFVTDSSAPEEPKEPEGNGLFALYKEFASKEQVAEMDRLFRTGTGWGNVKQLLYEAIEATVAEPRERYKELLAKPEQVNDILATGATRARVIGKGVLERVRDAVGITI